jgi:hypothetical protein
MPISANIPTQMSIITCPRSPADTVNTLSGESRRIAIGLARGTLVLIYPFAPTHKAPPVPSDFSTNRHRAGANMYQADSGLSGYGAIEEV